jgi:ParB family chromosome partitioning protein
MAIPSTRGTVLARLQQQAAKDHHLQNVLINSIRIGKRLRPLGDISSLIESIREVGLLSPISVTRDKCLISGLHRLEAFRALGRKYIPAFIVPISRQEAQIAEIDENLARNDLSLLERAEHLYRRKQIYEGLHPERRHGGNQYTGGKKCQDGNLQFCQTAAAASGRSATTVHRLVRIAKLLTAETKHLLRGTEWADNQQTLMKLCKLTPEMQESVAGKVAKGESKEIADAIAKVHRDRLSVTGRAVPFEDNDASDVNVLASDMLRRIESPDREEKLKQIIESRNYLNPTLRRQLVNALKNAATNATQFEQQLSADFNDFPRNGKCHQRIVREIMAEQPDPLIAEKKTLASDFKHAIVREISYDEAKQVVLANEYLASMGTTEFSYGLFFGPYLGGVCCFGRVGGTRVAESACGIENADKVICLVRGACLHWSHPHSGSFLVSAACRQIATRGFPLVIAFADPEAGEQGVILRACNFVYCGMTAASEKFKTPDGKVHDARQVHCLTRDRTGGTMKYRRSRAAQKELLLAQGCEFFVGTPKHRFVGFFGNRRTTKNLRRALRWKVFSFPKQPPSPEVRGQILDLNPAGKALAAFVS